MDVLITVNGALIDITGDPSRSGYGANSNAFLDPRGRGVEGGYTLEVTLRNALATDERVQFSFEDGIDKNDDGLRARLSEDFR